MTTLNQRIVILENEGNNITQAQLNTKQNTLIAGDNITIVDNVIYSTGEGGGTTDTTALQNQIDINTTDISTLQTDKQDKLTSGDNITITGNVTSATGGGGSLPADANFSTITSSGNVIFGGIRQTVNQISFLASRTTAQTITANGVLAFNSVVTNIGGGYNGSTYTFTAPLTGAYYLFTQFFTSQNNTYTLYIQKSIGTRTTILSIIERPTTGAGGATSLCQSVCAFLNSAKQVRVIKISKTSVFMPPRTFCYFGGCLIQNPFLNIKVCIYGLF